MYISAPFEIEEDREVLHVLMRDLNLPEIDYGMGYIAGAADGNPARFFDTMTDLFMTQHIQQHTRYREGRSEAINATFRSYPVRG